MNIERPTSNIQHPNRDRRKWLADYLIGEAKGVGAVCGVGLDFAAIFIWLIFFIGVLNVIGDYCGDMKMARLFIPILGWAIWWTYLRVTRAWHHSQLKKEAEKKEQAEIERVFLEQNRNN